MEISSNTHKSLSESTLSSGREHLILSRCLIRRPVDEDQLADFSWGFIISLISEIIDNISGLFSGERLDEIFPLSILRASAFKDNLRGKKIKREKRENRILQNQRP